jgi:integrase
MMPHAMNKPLYIKPSDRERGLNLVVYCLACKTNVYDKCKRTGKSLKNCKEGNKHRYKLYYPDFSNRAKRLTKTFELRDFNTVRQQALAIINKTEKETTANAGTTISTQVNTTQTDLLLPLMARYLTFLSGDQSIPLHQRRARSAGYIAEVQAIFKYFIECIKQAGCDINTIKAGDINRVLVGKYYEFLHDVKKYSNRSINKANGCLRTFFNYLIKYEELPVHNPFETVIKKPVVPNPQVISEEEFNRLLRVISHENGFVLGNGKKRLRNVFRPYLKEGLRLFLYTGRRRSEVVNIKFSDIIENKEGVPVTIKVEDQKVNNIQGVKKEGAKKMIYVPVTAELQQLLNELGYEKYKGSDRYLLAPNITEDRTNLIQNYSRAFSHYYSLLNTGRKLNLKCLRKTYITRMAIRMGSEVKSITGHSGNEVLKHYINQEEVAISLRNFSVFGSSRTNELEEVRTKQSNKNLTIEK